MLTPEKIEELRGLLAKATPGPWKNHLVDDTTIVASNGFEIGTTWPGGSVYNGFVDPAEQHEINAALIVAMRNAIPALLDAASRAREETLREAIEICKEADAQDDRDNGAAATGAACNAANAILALINKPKGGDVNAAVESRYGDATSPGVTAGASAGWRPIETAPVDLPVLLYCPNLGVANPERIELGPAHTSRGSHHSWATMWMPLPAAPVDGGEDA